MWSEEFEAVIPHQMRVWEQLPAAGRVPADRCRSADPTTIQSERKQTIETQSRAQPGCKVHPRGWRVDLDPKYDAVLSQGIDRGHKRNELWHDK